MTKSVEAGAVVPPADLRYLKKPSNPKGDSVVGKVLTYLQSLYESVAETLPDMRGEADCESVTLGPGEELPPDPYADAMDEVKPYDIKPRKKPRHFRSINVDATLDLEQDDRFLPPGGHMKDYWEQMLLEDPSAKVSFSQFWRVPLLQNCVFHHCSFCSRKHFLPQCPGSMAGLSCDLSCPAETWHQHFRCLKFRAASQHAVCSQCLHHKLLLRDLQPFLSARQSQQKLYANHLASQFRDRKIYWQTRGVSRAQSGATIVIIIDSMDQSKFYYPRGAHKEFQSKELGTFQRPKAHITCAIAHGYFILFTVSASDIRKDSSTMTDVFMHCLHLLKTQHAVALSQHTVFLQCDNTPREFKNNTFARLMGGLCAFGTWDRTFTACSGRASCVVHTDWCCGPRSG